MNINRHNYEEFFLLYIDNELSIAEKKAVEAFAEQHPDLGKELEMLQQSLLRPDKQIVFDDKASLLQPMVDETGINVANCETFFVLYADDELTNSEKAAVEDFVYRNPRFQQEFELLQQVRLEPDNSIVFENKQSLYRSEKDDKVVPIRWWRWAAAAILLLVAGLLWITREKKVDNIAVNGEKGSKESVAPVTTPVKKADETINPKENARQQQVAVVKEKKEKENNQPRINAKAIDAPVKNSQQQVAVVNNRSSQKEKTVTQQQKPLIAKIDVTDMTNVTDMTENKMKGSTIDRTNTPAQKIGINKMVAATSGHLIIDAPMEYVDPSKESNTDAMLTSSGDENIEVLNTSVNKQNGLRGLIRKASRIIAKKTNLGDGDGTRKGLLIGGFEIAVK